MSSAVLRLLLVLFGLVLLGTPACTTIREEQQPLADTTLIVTRAGEDTTLSWTAQPQTDYVIWYAERRDAQTRWKVLPGAERLRGQGAMTWRDRVPTGQTRYYRLQAVPAAARSL